MNHPRQWRLRSGDVAIWFMLAFFFILAMMIVLPYISISRPESSSAPLPRGSIRKAPHDD